MTLDKIYNEAYVKKKEEIFRRYNEEKKVVAKGKLPLFQKKFQEKINQEYAELFSQNTIEKSEYHFIETFSAIIPGVEDSYLTFDEDYANTKEFIKGRYMNHVYGPKVDIFFKQNDEVIVKKLGHLKAYNELRLDFVQALNAFYIAKSTSQNMDINEFSNSNQIEDQTTAIGQPINESVANEKKFTSIRQIADYFNCSIPTAQKIKNSIPKHQYTQKERTFAIRESVLLKNHGSNTKNY
ncbi:MAG: hypothetical protein R2764_22800 [Bacteroidales bacterium]